MEEKARRANLQPFRAAPLGAAQELPAMGDLLAKMGLSCQQWASMTDLQHLRLAERALLGEDAYRIERGLEGLGAGTLNTEISRRMRAVVNEINAYCLRQAVAAEHHEVTARDQSRPLTINVRPGGQIADAPAQEPIVLSSKNYMVGFGVGALVGAAIGATAMHLSMRKKSKR